MSDNKVINLFPKNDIAEPTTKEEVALAIDNIKKYHCEETINILSQTILDMLMVSSHKLDDEIYYKDIGLIIEAIRSLLYKSKSINHPLQKMSDDLLEVDDFIVRMKGVKDAPSNIIASSFDDLDVDE